MRNLSNFDFSKNGRNFEGRFFENFEKNNLRISKKNWKKNTSKFKKKKQISENLKKFIKTFKKSPEKTKGTKW